MRSPASARGLLLLAVVALGAATGCNAYLVNEGDPAAPILVQGRVVDSSGGGMSGARVEVWVGDYRDVQVGESVPIVYEGSFSAGLDGTFVVRLTPTPAMIELAGGDDGFVNFNLVVFANAPAPFAFQRELRGGTWAGEVPELIFGPDGVTGPGVDPGVPAPLPAGT